MFDFLEFSFSQRAFLAALLIGFSNGALGALIVLRQNALVVSALSHSLLPGIALGILFFGVLNPFIGFAGALGSALVVALGTNFIARVALLDHQTALSVLYTTAFAGGLVLLDWIPGFISLESWLFGNILGLRNVDLWITYAVASLIIFCLFRWRRAWILLLYEPSVAASMGIKVRRLNQLLTILMVLALVTSLQAVGAVLSAALIITPAAIVLQWVKSARSLIIASGLTGAGIALSALLFSHLVDSRPGAMIILFLGLAFILSLVIRLLRERLRPIEG